MVSYAAVDIFKVSANMLVNPCNTVGAYKAGLSKQFAYYFPENLRAYLMASSGNAVKRIEIGRNLYVTIKSKDIVICNFPTKKHWKNPSNLEYITLGLMDLREHLLNRSKTLSETFTVVMPPLGCGLGGLSISDVYPLIEEYMNFGDDSLIEVIICDNNF